MGNFCDLCNKEFGLFAKRIQVKDGYICKKCFESLGYKVNTEDEIIIINYDLNELKPLIQEQNTMAELIKKFKMTDICVGAYFDKNNRLMLIDRPKEEKRIYTYDQIIDFDLNIDGEEVLNYSNLGAYAGMLFGNTNLERLAFGTLGAIAYAKEKYYYTTISVDVYLKDTPKGIETFEFLDKECKKNSIRYNDAINNAKRLIEILQGIIAENEELEAKEYELLDQEESFDDEEIEDDFDDVDDEIEEIRKYKELYDEGVITLEEFEKKKAKIMGI